jgi:hypothetical protein
LWFLNVKYMLGDKMLVFGCGWEMAEKV